MNTLSPEPAAATTPLPAERPAISPQEFFLRFLAVVAGVGLGAIAALIVGLSAGWIPFSC